MACELAGGYQKGGKVELVVASLAANVVAVLAPYVAMGAQEFAKNAGKEAYKKAKSMLAILRARWSGEEEATDALTRFEEKPERYAPVLEDLLQEKLAQDEELAVALSNVLNEMGPSLEVVQRMKDARRVTGLEAEEMTGGRATVTQDIESANDVTGARIGRIGASWGISSENGLEEA